MSIWDEPVNTLSQDSFREAEIDLPWVDQLAQNILLTAQALQRLHLALDGKFTR